MKGKYDFECKDVECIGHAIDTFMESEPKRRRPRPRYQVQVWNYIKSRFNKEIKSACALSVIDGLGKDDPESLSEIVGDFIDKYNDAVYEWCAENVESEYGEPIPWSELD